MKFDFDKKVNRRNSNSFKWDEGAKGNELPMWTADMDFETCPYVKEAILKKASLGAYGYTIIPDEYYKSISLWWKKRHNYEIDPSTIIFTTGVVPAISSIVRRITQPGEKVLLQSPVYNIFYNSILNNGRKVVSNDLVYENDSYHIDFEDLEKKLSDPLTNLMILCNPHNPIGKNWSKEELERIGYLANKYHVIVLSDEVHCDLQDPNSHYIPFASVNDVNKRICISAIAPNKTFNIAGLQSGFVIIDDEALRNKVNRGLNNDEVAEPNFFCIEATIAAYTKGDEWVDALNEYIYENKCYFRKFVKENIPQTKVVPSQASYLLWVDISSISNNSEAFAHDLREKTGLFVCDGLEYGLNGSTFFRINLATQKENVIDGCNRLKSYIDSL